MKKAKLDTLEDLPDIEMEMSGDQQIALDHDAEETVAIKRKWAFNKLLIIFTPFVLIISGVLIYNLTKTNVTVHQTPTTVNKTYQATEQQMPITGKKMYQATEQQILEKTDPQQNIVSLAAMASESWRMVYLKDFMIDLKDSKGNNHVLMCDVAFDVGSKVKLEQLENNAGVRNIIYKTAQSRSVIALRSVEERKKMKKEVVLELEKILGQGSIKNVYFLNYFIM